MRNRIAEMVKTRLTAFMADIEMEIDSGQDESLALLVHTKELTQDFLSLEVPGWCIPETCHAEKMPRKCPRREPIACLNCKHYKAERPATQAEVNEGKATKID